MKNDFLTVYLTLNIAMFITCAAVVLHYIRGLRVRANMFRRINSPIVMSAQDWLILGIVVSFAGKILDAGYWHVAWRADELGKSDLLELGPMVNIFARQLPILAAAGCHVVAAIHSGDEKLFSIPAKAIAIGLLIFCCCEMLATTFAKI